jgi:uncharacterized protein YndB with AHSA1/START domain
MDNDFEAKLGHKFTFHAEPQPGWDGVTYCEVTELDPPRRIAYTWRGGAGQDKPPTLNTVVRFTLEPVEGGTKLVLEHSGFVGFRAIFVSFILGSGWAKMLRRLLPGVVATLARGDAPSGAPSCHGA